jgi:hypothetical protein
MVCGGTGILSYLGAMIACGADGLTIFCRVYNVQSKTVKMRRDETIMSAVSQEECYLWGI